MFCSDEQLSWKRKIAAFLNKLGINIEKPFEAIPVGPADGRMFYSGVQYVVIGPDDDFKETMIGEVRAFIADSHPMTDKKQIPLMSSRVVE